METPYVRKNGTSSNGHRIVFDDFVIDPANRTLARAGKPIPLTGKVFDILLVFVQNPGRLLEKDELLDRVWPQSFVEEGNLARHVSILRKALGDTGRQHRYILTIPGHGYRFIADIGHVDAPLNGSIINRNGTPTDPESQDPGPASTSPSAVPYPLTAIAGKPLSAGVSFRFVFWSVALLVVMGAGFAVWQFRNEYVSAKKFVTFGNSRLTKVTQSGDVYAPRISRDGQYMAYVSLEGNLRSLSVRHIASGSVLKVLPGRPRSFIWAIDIAPDNSFLYYILKEGNSFVADLYRMPLLGGPPFKIAQAADGGLAVSPDGSRIAFARITRGEGGHSSIVLVNNDGTGERTIDSIDSDSLYYSLDWAPDSTSLAVSVKRNDLGREYWEIEEVSLDGQAKKTIGQPSFGTVIRAEWLPDKSGLVVNAIDEAGKQPQIYYLSYPSGEKQRITNDLNHYQGISVTGDGRTILAMQQETNRQIWRSTSGSAAAGEELSGGTQKHFDSIAWGTNDQVFFDEDESSSHDNYNIWRMRSDGSEKQQLTFGVGNNTEPAVSPGGGEVVFVSSRTGRPQLWRMNADGRDPAQLTNTDHPVQQPEFGPDGKTVFFLMFIDGRFPLWKISISGGEPVQVLDEDIYRWVLSPDGNRIAYSTFDNDAKTVLTRIYSFTSGKVEGVLDISPETWMQWSNDGRAIYFNKGDDGARNVWRLDLATHKQTPVTKFDDQSVFRFSLSPSDKDIACIRQTISYDAVMLRAE